MQRIFEWCNQQSFVSWCGLSLIGNLLAAAVSILACWCFARVLAPRRIFSSPQPLTSTDFMLTIGTIFFNSVVVVVGWVLWQQGWIIIHHGSWLWAVADTVLLIVVMDFAMYALHRLAHHPFIFRIVHSTHHVHESTNPLSLFVLNPFEVLGFGFLLITVLMLYSFSGTAVIAYFAFNLIFGTVGHLGVEPLPTWLRRRAPFRYMGTSTFHGLHHAERTYNFGFYTTIWDRLFHTLDPAYDSRLLATHSSGYCVTLGRK